MASIVEAGKDAIRKFKFFQMQARKAGLKAGTDCWIWQGDTNATGYGETRWYDPKLRKNCGGGAHRAALEIKLGRPLATGMIAGHRCPGRETPDRRCCNPDHLEEISQSQNVQDIANAKIAGATGTVERTTTNYKTGTGKGRGRDPAYIDSIMPEVKVLRSQNWPWAEIAAKFDVSHSSIYKRYMADVADGASKRRSTAEVRAIYDKIKVLKGQNATWEEISKEVGIDVHRCAQIYIDVGRRIGDRE
jgi:hypothetical protein